MTYLILKACHLISMVAWMAGLLYLPRLYVYHAGADPKSETSELFKIMERKLLRFIMNPAMILTFIFGLAMIATNPDVMKQGWLHTKFLFVFALVGYHGYLARIRRVFEHGNNVRSQKFYRLVNEIPTVLLIAIVLLAVLKPF